MRVDELLEQALGLPRHERARLAEELLSSIEEPEDHAAVAWTTELERRSQQIVQAAVQLTPWVEARAELMDELEQRRACRPPS